MRFNIGGRSVRNRRNGPKILGKCRNYSNRREKDKDHEIEIMVITMDHASTTIY